MCGLAGEIHGSVGHNKALSERPTSSDSRTRMWCRSHYSRILRYCKSYGYTLANWSDVLIESLLFVVDNPTGPIDIHAHLIGRIASPPGSRQRQSRRKAV